MKERRVMFYGPDDGLDVAVPAPAVPSLFEEPAAQEPALPEGYAFADEAAAGPTQEQLRADYDKLMAENAALKSRPDPSAALAPVLQEFSEGIKGLAARPIQVQTPAAQGPEVDPEIEEKAIDENFLEGPTKNIKKIVGKVVGEPLQILLESNMSVARSLVGSREGEKGLFAKYGPEIEAEVARIPLANRARDPVGAYEGAVAIVRGRHYQELVAEERNAWQAQAQAQAAPAAAVPAPAPAAPRGAVLAGSPLAPAPAGARSITKAEAAKVKAYMDSNGTPADKFETILELVREGVIV